eukprot:scaffold4756_cov357-Prasinococcus_capsulatus_cf.AAC.3
MSGARLIRARAVPWLAARGVAGVCAREVWQRGGALPAGTARGLQRRAMEQCALVRPPEQTRDGGDAEGGCCPSRCWLPRRRGAGRGPPRLWQRGDAVSAQRTGHDAQGSMWRLPLSWTRLKARR